MFDLLFSCTKVEVTNMTGQSKLDCDPGLLCVHHHIQKSFAMRVVCQYSFEVFLSFLLRSRRWIGEYTK